MYSTSQIMGKIPRRGDDGFTVWLSFYRAWSAIDNSALGWDADDLMVEAKFIVLITRS
jgi:hypothetical protein